MAMVIEEGFRAFVAEGAESVGTVRSVDNKGLTVYVENAGDFRIPLASVMKIHDGKVVLDVGKLAHDFLAAVDHQHDREDPNLVG
jgi:hypothetical protein